HWRRPIDFTDDTLLSAAAQADRFRDAFVAGADAEAEWEQLAAVLDEDFNTAEALRVLHEWRSAGALGPLRRGLELFGLGSLAERTRAGRGAVAARDEAASAASPAGARADGDRGHRRSPGRRRALRALPLRRRARARGSRAPAARLPRPGHRPAEPRGGLPER